jgi:glycosyltransferase involved in cell wall biosynthesis
MKVLYDHLCFMQRYGGVPKYFVELLKRMPIDDVVLTVRYSNNEYLKELSIEKLHSFFRSSNFRGKARLESEFGKIFSIPSFFNKDLDIYHQTHYDPYAYKYLDKKIKTVTTIHDMNFWAIPSYYSLNNRTMRNQEISANKANHIITISNNSKNDICKYWNIPEEKISVIYHGINDISHNNIPEYESSNPYILFVGARNIYKNFEGIVKSFSHLKKNHPLLQLYCAGNQPSNQEKKMLKQFGILDSVMFFQASNEQLISLYKGAKVFVFPSFYEGFGLPILEAMAANCPVALSNASCFPEIAGEAGAYFNPYDIDDMTSIINNILCDGSYALSLKEKGSKRVKDFSWDKCAQQHLKVYQSLL